MALRSFIHTIVLAGAIPLSLTGCDSVDRQAEIQNNLAAFVNACNGKLSSELTLNAPSSSTPLSLKLTCDNADKAHSYFKELTEEDVQALKEAS